MKIYNLSIFRSEVVERIFLFFNGYQAAHPGAHSHKEVRLFQAKEAMRIENHMPNMPN